MTSEYFADTFYYLALMNPADARHVQAVRLSHDVGGRTLTTAWVLTELADGLTAVRTRTQYARIETALYSSPHVTVLPPTDELFWRGSALYRDRPDKTWSLTDCISFVAMKDRGITRALTGDHHFEQAGLVALLK